MEESKIRHCVVVQADGLGDVFMKANQLGGIVYGLERKDDGFYCVTFEFEQSRKTDFVNWYEGFDFSLEGKAFCNFCGKERAEVDQLLRSVQNDVFICNKCVVKSAEILSDESN